MALAALAGAGATASIFATAILGGLSPTFLAAAFATLALAGGIVSAFRLGALRWAGALSVASLALAWVLFFGGPLADREVSRLSVRETLAGIIEAVGDRDVALYRCNDALRGGLGFYGDRTPQEYTSAAGLVQALAGRPGQLVACVRATAGGTLPPALEDAALRAGVRLRPEARVPYGGERGVVVLAAETGRVSGVAR